jgi:hypothetical protein
MGSTGSRSAIAGLWHRAMSIFGKKEPGQDGIFLSLGMCPWAFGRDL